MNKDLAEKIKEVLESDIAIEKLLEMSDKEIVEFVAETDRTLYSMIIIEVLDSIPTDEIVKILDINADDAVNYAMNVDSIIATANNDVYMEYIDDRNSVCDTLKLLDFDEVEKYIKEGSSFRSAVNSAFMETSYYTEALKKFVKEYYVDDAYVEYIEAADKEEIFEEICKSKGYDIFINELSNW